MSHDLKVATYGYIIPSNLRQEIYNYLQGVAGRHNDGDSRNSSPPTSLTDKDFSALPRKKNERNKSSTRLPIDGNDKVGVRLPTVGISTSTIFVDDKKVLQMVYEVLRKRDKNGNGKIDSNEEQYEDVIFPEMAGTADPSETAALDEIKVAIDSYKESGAPADEAAAFENVFRPIQEEQQASSGSERAFYLMATFKDQNQMFAAGHILQQEGNAANLERYGLYCGTTLYIGAGYSTATAVPIMPFAEGFGTFHSHPSRRLREVEFIPDVGEFSDNAAEMPSPGDIMSFLAHPIQESTLFTETLTIKFRKTRATPAVDKLKQARAKLAQVREIDWEITNVDRIDFTVFMYMVYEWILNHSDKYRYLTYDSVVFVDVMRDVFNLEVEIYDGSGRRIDENERLRMRVSHNADPNQTTQATEALTENIKILRRAMFPDEQ